MIMNDMKKERPYVIYENVQFVASRIDHMLAYKVVCSHLNKGRPLWLFIHKAMENWESSVSSAGYTVTVKQHKKEKHRERGNKSLVNK